MSEDQIADVKAGLLNIAAVIPTNTATAAAISLLASGTTGAAAATTDIMQGLDVVQVEGP
jgi:hypothetical protein